MAKPDGGPAFARAGCTWTEDHGDGAWSQDGMSLRDYFAAKAMQAEIITSFSDATPKAAQALAEACAEEGHSPEQHVALNAYKLADAMLKARDA